jgi:hypothetical protein
VAYRDSALVNRAVLELATARVERRYTRRRLSFALVAPPIPGGGLTGRASMFHICSHGSRNHRRGAELGLEGPYALQQWLPAGNQVYEALRLPQATGP